MQKLKFDKTTKELINMCCTDSEAASKMNSVNRLTKAVDEIINTVNELQNKEVYDAAYRLGQAIKKHIDVDRCREAEKNLLDRLNKMLVGKIIARDDSEGMYTVIRVKKCKLSNRTVLFEGDVIEMDTSPTRPSLSASLIDIMTYCHFDNYELLTEKELSKLIDGIRNKMEKHLKVFGR